MRMSRGTVLNVSMYYVTPLCPHKSLTLAARDNSATQPSPSLQLIAITTTIELRARTSSIRIK